VNTIDIDPTSILIRYNVKQEKEMTPEEAAAEFYPDDDTLRPIIEAVFEGNEDEVVEAIQCALEAGKDPLYLIDYALMVGMDIVSKLYDDGVLFLPDVVISSHAMKDGIEYCKERSKKQHEYKGKVVCYVAQGDMHDIGKKIVTVILRANGYEVIDLGRDVSISEIIDAVKKEKPLMLTGTALMTTTMYSFIEVNDFLLENGVKIPFVCGGGAVKQEFVSRFELGVYCEDASYIAKIADDILKNATIKDLREKYHRH
jgi:methanol corrinoid protein